MAKKKKPDDKQPKPLARQMCGANLWKQIAEKVMPLSGDDRLKAVKSTEERMVLATLLCDQALSNCYDILSLLTAILKDSAWCNTAGGEVAVKADFERRFFGRLRGITVEAALTAFHQYPRRADWEKVNYNLTLLVLKSKQGTKNTTKRTSWKDKYEDLLEEYENAKRDWLARETLLQQQLASNANDAQHWRELAESRLEENAKLRGQVELLKEQMGRPARKGARR